MASNFRISISKEKSTLHLKLKGDFDGTSALELIDILNKNNGFSKQVMIHTENLGAVYPFGVGVFTNHLPARYRDSASSFFTHNKAAAAA